MRFILGSILTLVMASSAFAGIFDNTPFDRRTPIEKCQAHIANTYGGYGDLLSACSNIRTEQSLKCVKAVSERSGRMSNSKIAVCSYVNTDEALKSVKSVINEGLTSEDILTAASLSNTKNESACVVGLVKNSSTISIKNLVDCSDDGLIAYMKRLASIAF